jgi:hypothetical protein
MLFVLFLTILVISWALYLRIVENRPWHPIMGLTEFTSPNGDYIPAKTIWDFLDLIVVPAVLATGAFLFNKSQKDNELRIAKEQKESEQIISDDRQKEQVLQNYLDKMAELLLEKKLLEKKVTPDDPVVEVAKIRTITALRALDVERKNLLLQFLRDSGLGEYILRGASLADADLSDTRLVTINLVTANLSESRPDPSLPGGSRPKGSHPAWSQDERS